MKNNIDQNNKQHINNVPSTLLVQFGGYSSAGLKAENQDAFAAFSPSEKVLKVKGAIAAIADGVSSASKAAEAAQLSVTQFIDEYYSTPETWATTKSAAKVLTSLNQWLFSQTPQTRGTGLNPFNETPQWLTTFSTIIFKSATGYLFHVGDTRISQYRQNQLEPITRDHNQKSGAANIILTRALGADLRLKVDVHQVDLQVNDIYLLTSDGVHEYLSDQVIKAALKNVSSSPKSIDLERASKNLVEQAIQAGSDDNVSCLLCYVERIAEKKIAEIERDLFSKVIPPALKIGHKIDDFKVISIIHETTRSHVYLVESQKDKSLFVLKTPSINFSDDAMYLQGFMREAWVGERVNHPNIMSIINPSANADKESKYLYHLCEYINGQTLTQWMQDNPNPSLTAVRNIIQQIITALRVFQRLDIVHRDLKPDNIMIDTFGQVKLIDYGAVFVASLDENKDNLTEQEPQGSLNYIAPETLLTMKADHLSDLFSLGVICYEMLTGELPFKPMTRAEVNFKDTSSWHYRSIKKYRPDLPFWLDLSLQQATSADVSTRYQAYSEFEFGINKADLSAIEAYKKQPLLQRNPVKFWQGISFILFVVVIYQSF